MAERTRTALAIAVLAALAGMLYARQLGDIPPHLMHDESQFALQAQSIAASGRDLGGRFLPMFFSEPEFPAGRDPVIIYATAATLKFIPFSESSARLATALVGALDVVLVFLVVRALFGSTSLGLMGALLMACTPVHFIRARLALSPMYSVPFILLWLWTLVEYERRPSTSRIALAGAWLGLGLYTYLACVVMMPVYLVTSIAWLLKRHGVTHATTMVVAFVAVLVPMLIWYGTHPERVSQIFGSYREYSSAPPAASIDGLRARAALYWSFFDPAFLFISGDSSLVNSTRQAGFFPAAFAVLLPVGLYRIARSQSPMFWLIGAGFLLAPLAAVLSGAIEMNRLMFAIPFGVLVASIAAVLMLRGRRWERAMALVLVASVPVQFARFHADYTSRYREQAGAWFGGDIRGVYMPILTTEPQNGSGSVFISERIPFAHRYWRFYALEAGRPDLIDTPTYFVGAPPAAPPGAKVICATASADCQALGSSPDWQKMLASDAPASDASFDVFVRKPS